MTDDQATLRVTGGMDVVGSDGEKLGTVDRVEGNYVVASKGFFFPTDYYIPVDAIATVDEDRVHLNVTKDVALDQGWDSVPAESTTTYAEDTTTADPLTTPLGGTTGGVVGSGVTGTPGAVADEVRPEDSGLRDTVTDRGAGERTSVDAAETLRVPLSEEELTATTRGVDRGSVQIQKDVVSEEQTLDVPVTEERVNVTRRTVDRAVAPGESEFEGGTIDVPVRGEEVEVQKRARVREELEVTKDAVQDTQRVTDTVRREEAHVADTTDTVRDDATTDRRDRDQSGR